MARAGVAQDQNIFKRLWWAAIDKQKIEKLVADVHTLIRALWHLLDPLLYDDLVNFIGKVAAYMITVNNRVDQLPSLTEAIHTSSAEPHSAMAKFAASAEIKALVVGLDEGSQGNSYHQISGGPKRQELLQKLERLSRLKLEDFKSMKKHETMGLAEYDGESVFVEWKFINLQLRIRSCPELKIWPHS